MPPQKQRKPDREVLIVSTRGVYYISNGIGFVIILGLILWLFMLSFKNGAVEIKSVFFWLAILLLIIVPFAIISFFSSMKSITVTKSGLLISYSFTKQTSSIDFSAIAEFKSNVSASETKQFGIRDSFRLTLTDGRVFEFGQAQFDHYPKFKSMVRKAVIEK